LALASCWAAVCSPRSSPASEANLTVRDKKLLAAAPYEKATIPEPYRRHLVEYHRKEAPGTIVIDSDARYLYYVLPEDKAIRYGVAVGEEAMAWSGVAKVGRMTEWPSWTPTPGERARMDVPDYVSPGPQNPMGARAMYLFEGNKDTLYRIHGIATPFAICFRRAPHATVPAFGKRRSDAELVKHARHDMVDDIVD
jgi:lipoprotein-anchoring transpeptidase ErfK/SrfK